MTALHRRPLGTAVLAASLLGLGAAAPAARAEPADPGLPFPEEHGSMGWVQKQRVYFYNRPLWQSARHAIAAGDYPLAHKHLRAILANDPQSNLARVNLIEVCGKLGRHEEGMALCDELLAIYPDYAAGYLSKAFLAGAAGKTNDALRAFDALLQRPAIDRPQKILAVQNGSELAMKAGRYDEGLALCDRLLARYPDCAEGYLSQAFLAIAAGKTDLALHAFDGLLRQPALDRAQKLQTVQNAAELALKFERYDLAELYGARWLEWADELRPRLFLVECAIKQERWAQAVERIDRALELVKAESLRGELFMKKAFVLVKLGRVGEADGFLTQARERMPGREDRLTIDRQLGFNAALSSNSAAAVVYFKAYLAQAFDESVARGYLDATLASEEWELACAEGKAMLKRPGISPELREQAQRTILYACKHLNNPLGVYVVARELAELEGKKAYLPDAAQAAVALDEIDEAVRLYRVYLEWRFDPAVALACQYLLKRQGRSAEGATSLLRIVEMPVVPVAVRHAALYELAQLSREQKRPDRYQAFMKELLNDTPETRFLHEYAVQLYGAGQYEAAADAFANYYEIETNAAARYATCAMLGDLNMTLKRPAEAVVWLNRAAAVGPRDIEWQFRMARAEYAMGEYLACIDRLSPLSEGRDIFCLYVGFAFSKLNMPGLALMHLDRIRDCKDFTPQERFTLYANRAYLLCDQDQDVRALAELNSALEVQDDPELELVRLKVLARLGYSEEALDVGRLLLEVCTGSRARAEVMALLRDHPDTDFRQRLLALVPQTRPAYLGDICQTLGVAASRLDRPDEANAWFSKALEYDPGRLDTFFVRGLVAFKQGRFKDAEDDFVTLYERGEKTNAVPASFWSELGILEGKTRDFDLGTAALKQAVETYSSDVDSMREAGYQFMKWRHNAEAQQSFQAAADFYEEVLPYLDSTNAEEYALSRYAMLKENSKLDKTLGLQAYVNKTDFGTHTQGPAPKVSALDGALPSQAGIMGTYRPPEIGFRDERQFDVFGRVIANFEPHSWALDRDSYQGGVGGIYKPFITQNYTVGLERLFKIGANAENNWLWHNAWFWERGQALRDRSWWLDAKVYGEISYYLQDPKRWIFYVDGRLGPSFPLNSKITLTIPRLMAIGRYQTENDPTGLGSYVMTGFGANLRVIEPERRHTTERWYVDAFADYAWGWFNNTPEGSDRKDFRGVVFGVNFVK